MHTKKNASFIVTVALSMIILAYITFVTVYEQILSQNNGFFNVIIFGVVLVLVFIFITLLARIITVRTDKKTDASNDSSVVLQILISIGIIAIFVFFTMSRLNFSSTIPPSEAPLYRTAQYIISGQLLQGADIHSHIIAYPADFTFGFVLSKVFLIFEESPKVFIAVNIAMMLITAIFLYLSVKLIAGQACATVSIIIMMFMPNHAYLIYAYTAELFTSALFMIMFFLFELLIYRRFKSNNLPLFISILAGIFGGLCIFCEPVIILAIIVFTAWLFESKKQVFSCNILPLIIAVSEMLVLSFIKSLMIGTGFFDVLKGIFMCFAPGHMREDGAEPFSLKGLYSGITGRLNSPSRYINDTFYFLTDKSGKSLSANQAIWLDLANQLVYIFMLILCVLCIVYILRVSYDKIVPAFSVFSVLFIGQILGGTNSVCYIYFTCVIILIGSTTIYYMYLNHHPDYAVYITNREIRRENEIKANADGSEINEDESEVSDNYKESVSPELIKRARALVFVGEDDELYERIKEEERLNKINNPVAYTRIKTTLDEQGVYDSVEENVEFFDEPDKQVEVKKTAQVKTIPATRPVEVVKPVLSDDYDEILPNQTDLPKAADKAEDVNLKPMVNHTDNDSAISPDIASGFVFRKKTENNSNNVTKDDIIKTPNEKSGQDKSDKDKLDKFKSDKDKYESDKKSLKKKKPEKISKEKMKPEKAKAEKKTKLKDVKPGEPLPNPLPTPDKPKLSDLDFDYDIDVGTEDDFDF